MDNSETPESIPQEETINSKLIYENIDVGLKNPTKAFASMHKSRFCSVTLKVQDNEICANPFILALGSPFFDSLLADDSHEHFIELNALDFNAVSQLIIYLYTGKVEILEHTAEDLILAANKFQLSEVTNKCVEFLMSQFTTNNCFRIRSFALKNQICELFDAAEVFIKNNLAEMSKCEDFLNLDVLFFLRTIPTFSISASNSSIALDAVLRWVQHDVPLRKAELPQLIRNIDLSKVFDCAPFFLQEVFADGSILKDDPICLTMYYKACEAKAFELNSELKVLKLEKITINDFVPKIRQINPCEFDQIEITSLSLPNNVSIDANPNNNEKENPSMLNPVNLEEECQSVFFLSETTGALVSCVPSNNVTATMSPPTVLTTLPPTSELPATLLPPIATTASQPQPNALTASLPLAPSSPSKRQIPQSIIESDVEVAKRQRIASIESEQSIEPGSISGLPNDYTIKNILLVYPRVDRKKVFLDGYDFSTKTTQVVHQAKIPRRLSTLVIHEEKLFDIGGTFDLHCFSEDEDASTASNAMELFSKNKKFSSSQLRLLEPRKEFAACVCQNYLYVIGGCQGIETINCVERLLVNKRHMPKWETAEYLEFTRAAHDAVVLHDKIYTIGGIGQSEYRGAVGDLATVIRYKPENDTWENMPSMNVARGYVKAAKIGDNIFAVGGNVFDAGMRNRRSLNTVEVFNPTRPDSGWSFCSPLNHCRSRGALIAHNDLIYAIGGNSKINPSMEVFDPRIGKWLLLEWPIDLNKEVSFLSAISYEI